MKNIKALLKLDFELIKPYWMWLLMFLGIAIVLTLVTVNQNNSAISFIISLIMFAGTFICFPFESTDNSNLNVLYASLPTNRKSIIVARYISILIILATSLIVAVVGSILMDLAFSNPLSFSFIATFTCIAFALYMFNVGFQTPFMYRFGYVKGKIFIWIPIIIVMAIMFIPDLLGAFDVIVNFNIFNILLQNPLVTSLVSLGAGIIFITVSFFISRAIYLKKDF